MDSTEAAAISASLVVPERPYRREKPKSIIADETDPKMKYFIAASRFCFSLSKAAMA